MPADRLLPERFGGRRGAVLAVVAACLILNLWAVSRGWRSSLRDAFETRQAQTALTTYYFMQDGWRLDYQTPLLGPPWSIPMEFPTYQAVTAGVAHVTGLRLEKSGRLTGIFFFYAMLPALWLLLRPRLSSVEDRLLVLGSVLVCPTFLFYTRTIMIESTALCLLAWFLVAFDAALRRASPLRVLAAWVAGGFAICTKVTTFAGAWIALGLLTVGYILAHRRAGLSWRAALQTPLLRALLILVVPLALGAGWVIYSDHVKELNPYGGHLTSAALQAFNLGTIQQRFSGEWWSQIAAASGRVLNPFALVLLLAGIWFVPRAHRLLALACLLAFPGGLVLFANLYAVHDYYFYASAGFLAVAFGAIAAGLLHVPRLPAFAAFLALAVGLALQANTYRQTYYRYFFAEHPAPPPPVEATLSRALTPENEPIAGFGLDWNGIYPYYAQRRGLMVFESETGNFELLDKSLAGLGSTPITTVLVGGRFRKEYPFIGELRKKLALTAQPIAQTGDIDIYVRRDHARAAARVLWTRSEWGGAIPNFGLAEIGLSADATHDLRQRKLSAFTPAPFLSKGPLEIGELGLEGQTVVNTNAPAEIHFQPPPGSHAIEAVTGLLPGSYTDGNATAGITVAVFEEFPDGRRRFLFERELRPLTRPGDRGDIPIAYAQPEPFSGTLVFAHYGIVDANFNYCWGYWKRIHIH